MTESELNNLTKEIIGIAINVHKELGPGLLAKVYHACMAIALKQAGYHVETNIAMQLTFRDVVIAEDGYYIDMLVNGAVIVEIKSASEITKLNEKQLGTYLKLSGKRCGLILNFNSTLLKDGGIKRQLNGFNPL